MSKTIQITIEDKRPSVVGAPIIVCGNSDYTVEFTFDAEWASLTSRVARFAYIKGGVLKYKDVPFTGSTVEVPVLSGIREVMVGVYAGELRTTTPARIPCEYSILCGNAEEEFTEVDKATLQAQIGDMASLETGDKSSLVAAINWLYGNAGLSEDEVKSLFNDLANDAPLCVRLLTGTMEANKTFDEINDAYQANRNVIFVSTYNEVYICAAHQPGQFDFERIYGGTEGTTRTLTLHTLNGWTMGDEKIESVPLCVELLSATMTANKTYEEIREARMNGRTVLVSCNQETYISTDYPPGSVNFTAVVTNGAKVKNLRCTWDGWEFTGETDVFGYDIVTDVSTPGDDVTIPTTQAVYELFRRELGLLNNVAEVGA